MTAQRERATAFAFLVGEILTEVRQRPWSAQAKVPGWRARVDDIERQARASG